MYQFSYGQANGQCNALSNYNLYDPTEAISGIIAYVSADSTSSANCNKSFYNAFHVNGSWSALQSRNADLVGYRLQPQGAVYPMAPNRVDDKYELLMKGIAGYNGSTDVRNSTWANMLTVSHTLLMGQSYSNRTCAIQVMRRYGIPARTYVWVGARYQPPHQSAGQPEWCFQYGESEWLTNTNWADVWDDAMGDPLAMPPAPPVGRINCNTGVAIP